MRLIDAEAFKKQIVGMTIVNNYPVEKANALCELIDAHSHARKYAAVGATHDVEHMDGKTASYEHAIEIVKSK